MVTRAEFIQLARRSSCSLKLRSYGWSLMYERVSVVDSIAMVDICNGAQLV